MIVCRRKLQLMLCAPPVDRTPNPRIKSPAARMDGTSRTGQRAPRPACAGWRAHERPALAVMLSVIPATVDGSSAPNEAPASDGRGDGLVGRVCCGHAVSHAHPATVNDVLDGQVALDLECLDRIYLNAYVPSLRLVHGAQGSAGDMWDDETWHGRPSGA